MIFKLLIILTFSFLLVFVPSQGGRNGAKSVGRVGHAALGTTLGSGSTKNEIELPKGTSNHERNKTYNNSHYLAQLKHFLLVYQGYDKFVRPVINQSHKIYVEIEFTYKQVLELNEKSQILKSLFYSKMYWNDAFLTWDPKDFNNISEIIIPASMVWMPDVACDEDTGERSYSPRLPYVVVRHDGVVAYSEPAQYQTACSVDIIYFPFDHQHCRVTLLSWTMASDKLDLLAKRNTEELIMYSLDYFIGSGEWFLYDIAVFKRSIDYSQLRTKKNFSLNEYLHPKNGAIHDTTHIKEVYIDSKLKIEDIAPDRITNHHWAVITYSYKFRRNASLHLQSMLFPAILLTTISLLGFYLPPDSGERIGLQITILLTFMVFLLTVRDMFPASSSTGPYLGIYYVMCMTLLGGNITMTILVLNLHYVTSKSVISKPDVNGICKICMDSIPYWVKLCLLISGKYNKMSTFEIPCYHHVKDSSAKDQTFWGSSRTVSESFKDKSCFKRRKLSKSCNLVSVSAIPNTKSVLNTINGNIEMKTNVRSNGSQNQDDSMTGNRGSALFNSSYRLSTMETERSENHSGSQKAAQVEPQKDHQGEKLSQENWLFHSSCDLLQVTNNIRLITGYLFTNNEDLKEQQKDETVEEHWKSVAREIDGFCLRLYLFLTFTSHFTILLVANLTYIA